MTQNSHWLVLWHDVAYYQTVQSMVHLDQGDLHESVSPFTSTLATYRCIMDRMAYAAGFKKSVMMRCLQRTGSSTFPNLSSLVGGFNHLEKIESQWEGLYISYIMEKIFQTTNQISYHLPSDHLTCCEVMAHRNS